MQIFFQFFFLPPWKPCHIMIFSFFFLIPVVSLVDPLQMVEVLPILAFWVWLDPD
jgi:hypothetical protein